MRLVPLHARVFLFKTGVDPERGEDSSKAKAKAKIDGEAVLFWGYFYVHDNEDERASWVFYDTIMTAGERQEVHIYLSRYSM